MIGKKKRNIIINFKKRCGKRYYHDAKQYENQNDINNMLENLEKSAKFNNTNAMIKLGLYYYGIKRYDIMLEWYIKAVTRNNKQAKILLWKYYEEKNNVDNMLLWLKILADNNNQEAILKYIRLSIQRRKFSGLRHLL